MGIAWYTDERAKSMTYSRPYLQTQIVLIKHRDDSSDYQQTSDLDNKHFGVLRGYGYLNLVQSDSIQKTVLNSLEQSFRMLSNKRIDLTLEEKLNAHHRLSFLPDPIKEQVVIGNHPLQVKDLHITISKNIKEHERIIADFNQGLDLIIKDGTYVKIIKSHQPQPLGIVK